MAAVELVCSTQLTKEFLIGYLATFLFKLR